MANKNKKKKKLKKSFLILFIIIGILILVFGTVFCVIKFVPNVNILTVKNFEIIGEVPYSSDLIVKTSEISLGRSILKISLGDAEEKLEENLPYIKEANISYSLNGTVTFSLIPSTPKYQIKNGAYYYLLDEDCKIIEKSAQIGSTASLVYGVSSIGEFELGQEIEFNDSAKIEIFNEIAAFSAKYKVDFLVIDLENIKKIICVYKDRFVVELGTNNYIEDKIKLFASMLKEMDEDDEGRVRLDNWLPDNRKGWLISQNIDEKLEKYFILAENK